jgi:spermidine synthase
MRCDAPDELVMPYTRTMMGFLLFEPRPEKIVMIGLGGGSIAKYCHSRISTASVSVVEVNPYVVALRDLFRIPRDDERFRIVCEDGATFVRGVANSTDVLLVDGFDSNGQAAQLCTQRFYDDCYRSLAPDGLLVVNLVVEDPFLERSVSRIRRTFGSAVAVDSKDYANRVVFASKGNGLCLPHEQLCARLGALERDHAVDLRDTLQRIRYEQYKPRATI